MEKQKLPIVSIILFVLSGLLLIFTVWAATNSFKYIGEMVSMGQIVVKDVLFDIISFHMNSFGQYLVYAVLLFAAGWVVYLIESPEEIVVNFEDDVNGTEGETLEGLIEEIQAEVDATDAIDEEVE